MWQNSRSTYLESRFLAAGGIQSTLQKRKLSALSSFSSTICSKINTHGPMFTFMPSVYMLLQRKHCFSHSNSNLCIFLYIIYFMNALEFSKPITHLLLALTPHRESKENAQSVLPPSTRRQYFLGKAPGL